ncbi:hypothetical protein [Streptomyces xanthophaeus]|nr:hypothetical protein [Streptomyces xanthophaeus]
MVALIDINKTALPGLETKWSGDVGVPDLSHLFAHLGREERNSIQDGFRELAEEMQKAIDASKKAKEDGLDGEPWEGVVVRLEGPASTAMDEFFASMFQHIRAGSRSDLMRRSLLVSTISGFEVLFASIARSIYDVNTSALNDSDYSFTLQQISEFSSIEDAREYLVERKAAALMRESIDGWEKWLKKAGGGLSMTGLPAEWPTIREAFARRNLVVHAGSKVNHLYLESIRGLALPESLQGKCVGDVLEVSDRYLTNCLENILALGRLLSTSVGLKMHRPHRSTFLNMLMGEAKRCSRLGLWTAALPLVKYALSLGLSRRDELEMQAIHWLAVKKLHGVDAIRSDVEAWDTGGLSLVYSHRKYVLLDLKEKAVTEMRKLLDDGELNALHLLLDPLYFEMREEVVELIKGRNIDAPTLT